MSTAKNVSENQVDYKLPFLIMVFLFFLIGFLTVVNQQFQAPLKSAFDLSNAQTTLLTFIFFIAYPIIGTPAGWLVNQYGYKKTLIIALFILLIALAIFYLAAELVSFPIFLGGSFVVGSALTILQVVVNPYISACGPADKASNRLILGGGLNSLGTVLAPLFVSFVIFGGKDIIEVNSVKIPYIGLMISVVLIILAIKSFHLPHIPGTTREAHTEGSSLQYRHLVLGVIGIFFYVGAEVAVGANINLYLIKDLGYAGDTASKIAALYWLGLMIGRLSSGFLMKEISGESQLKVAAFCALILSIAGIVLTSLAPGIAPYAFVLIGLFHSVMWPCIFTLAIKDLGPHTSHGSGMLMIGVMGGAIIPFFQGWLADTFATWQWTWILVVIAEAYIIYYALSGHKVIQPKKN